jgi:hypothetical protein
VILYLVGAAGQKKIHSFLLEKYPDIGVLCSFAYPALLPKAYQAGFRTIMMDSGAFTVEQKGIKLDIDKLADYLLENKDMITVAVSLDVISDGEESVKNWHRLRQRGVETMPVFHFLGESWDILDTYCQETDYIGLGGVAGTNANWRGMIPILERIFLRHPDKKFHLFGVNDLRVVQNFPLYSADALSWRSGSRFSQLVSRFGRYHLNINRATGRCNELKMAPVFDFLEQEYGLTKDEILAPDFDWCRIDQINVVELYKALVLGHTVVEITTTVSHDLC